MSSSVVIAYVILAHKAPAQVIQLVRRLESPASAFFIHLDAKAGREIEREIRVGLRDVAHVYFVPRRRVSWGDFSTVRAMVGALGAALESEVGLDHAVFLSGQDYPIKPPKVIEDRLRDSRGWSFLPHARLPVTWPGWAYQRGGLDRFEYRHVRVPGRGPRRLPGRRPIPSGLVPFVGQQWGSLSRDHVEYVVRFAQDNRKVMRFFKYVSVPDESFLHTILLNSPSASTVKDESLHFIRWSEPYDHPDTLHSKDIPELSAAPQLFARKFDASVDPSVLQEVDRQLLGEATL